MDKKHCFGKLLAVLLTIALLPVYPLQPNNAYASVALPVTGMQVSDSYASGEYYQKLLAAMTESIGLSPAERFVKIAVSQKGYKGSTSSSSLAGNGNCGKYTEYSRYRGCAGLDWCAAYVSWCMEAAGLSTSVMPRSNGAGLWKRASVGEWHKMWSDDFTQYIDYKPQVGDLCLYMPYHDDGSCYKHYNSYGLTSHVVIVASVGSRNANGGWDFTTIERGANNTVAQNPVNTKQKRTSGTTCTCASNTASDGSTNAYVVQGFYHPNWSAASVWYDVPGVKQIVTPDIATNKEGYTPGETVNISWVSSNEAPTLSHYWIIIRDNAGNTLVNEAVNLPSTGYSYTLSPGAGIGSYTIQVGATPKGSVSGEGTLWASKTISVVPPCQGIQANVLPWDANERYLTWDSVENAVRYEWNAKNFYDGVNNPYTGYEGENYLWMDLDVGYYDLYCTIYDRNNYVLWSGKVTSFNHGINEGPYSNSDGWYYTWSLPEGVRESNCEIEYYPYYYTEATTHPGGDWQYMNSTSRVDWVPTGEPYWSYIPLTTSEYRRELGYYYYHYCSGSTGTEVNYAGTSKFPHGDFIYDVNSVTVNKTLADNDDSRIIGYQLKWSDGSLAYCNSNRTCDGAYGTHGNRSPWWFRNTQYQDYESKAYTRYVLTPGWRTTWDSNANAMLIRYRGGNTITFDANNGSISGDPTVKTTYKTGAYNYVGWLEPTRPSAFFEGWYTDPKGGVQVYNAAGDVTNEGTYFADSVWVGREDITLYAHWKMDFRFVDVKLGGWQETAVRYVLENQIMSGRNETTFDPNTAMTRAQLVTVLWNIEGQPKLTGTMPFSDVSSKSVYYKAILWGSQNKIINGYATGEFKPSEPLTRQQIAAILMNYSKFKGVVIKNLVDIGTYKDAASVSKSMTTAMQWAVGNKIISGKSNGTMLDPKGQATRVEVAAMVMNYCKKFR